MMVLLWMLGCVHAPLAPPGEQCIRAENQLITTEDGATIAVHRHRSNGPPVMVVHGISANHRSWDLTAERSLAVALQSQGYDAWLVDLRGHGLAHQHENGREQRAGWHMEDYGRYDISAAISHIQQQTGYTKLGYVGHSMGGMVAAIHHAIHGDDAFAAMVIVASPVDFADPDRLLNLAHGMVTATHWLRVIPTPSVARFGRHLRRLPFHGDALLWSEDNFSDTARDLTFQAVPSPMTRREVRDLMDIVDSQHFSAATALPSLDVPIRVIAGRADRIAPPDRVEAFYALAGSMEKDFVLAAKTNGFAHDYGHVDLVLGDAAQDEIYPLITEWFAGRW